MATKLLLHFDQSTVEATGKNFTGNVGYFGSMSGFGYGATGFDANNYLSRLFSASEMNDVFGNGNSFTVEFFLKNTVSATEGHIFDIGSRFSVKHINDGTTTSIVIYTINSVGTSLDVLTATVPTHNPSNIDGSWYHVAVSLHAGSLKVFVDGVQVGSFSGVAQISAPYYTGPETVTIGNSGSMATFGNKPFTGVIDELRVSNEILVSDFTAPTSPYTYTSSGGGQTMANQIDKRFIKNGAIDGDKIKILSGQSIKAETTSGTEVELLKVGTDGVVKALNQEIAYKSQVDAVAADLSTEVATRASEDAAKLAEAKAYADQKVADLVGSAPAVLDTLKELADALGSDPNFATTISNQIGAVASDLATETTNRTNADLALQADIDAEEAARIAAVSAEESARIAADAVLQANITAEESARIAAVSAEATARASADTTLQANIDAEATARAAADVTLQANIDAEATARTSADDLLQDNIDAEALARASADTTLQGNIDSLDAKVEGEFGFQSVVSSATPVALTAATRKIEVTGSVAQVVKLPSVATLKVGSTVEVYNRTNTGLVIQDATGTVLSVGGAGGSIPAQYQVKYICTAINSANEQTWKFIYSPMRSGTLGLSAGALPIYNLPAMTDADSGDKAVPKSYLTTKYAELQSQISGSATNFNKTSFGLTSTDITAGYIDLPHTVKAGSLVVHLGRLGIFEDEDYTLSVVGGVTRLTFGALIGSGVEAPIAGDKIFVRYAY